MNAVSETIARSILYEQSAREVWIQLERRFCLSNGSRKYSLNKEVYSMKQDRASISEYYTKMKCIWEELDSMMDLPQITQTNEEITAFLRALLRQQKEQKLFQFLNELDENYSTQRSHVLLMTPLPSIETVFAMLQQEELQREVLDNLKPYQEASALLSKGHDDKCSQCGNKGHDREMLATNWISPLASQIKKVPTEEGSKKGAKHQNMSKADSCLCRECGWKG